jgi:hypothetical protein
MNLENLHAHMHINALANGTAEVMFMGQPALAIGKNSFNTVDGDTSDAYHWVINPVFAKLTYGANILSDVPYCTKNYATIEQAAAEGMAKLEEIGAFKTITELPDDTYSNAKKYVDEDLNSHALSCCESLAESMSYLHKIKLGIYKPSVDFKILESKVLSEESLSESEKLAQFEYAQMGKFIFSKELVTESLPEGSEQSTNDQSNIERVMTLFEAFKAEKAYKQISEADRLVSTHEYKDRAAKVYKRPETGEHVVKFFTGGKHQKDADYFVDGDDAKSDAQGTAKHWVSNAKTNVEESFNDDDYYVVDPSTKKVVSRIGKPTRAPSPYSDPTNHPEFKTRLTDPKHKVMSGMQARHGGFVQEDTRSEFDANQMLTRDKPVPQKRSVRIIGPTGGTVSKHTTLSDAKRTFIDKKLSTKTHSIVEDTETGEINITENFDGITESYEQWLEKLSETHSDQSYVVTLRTEHGVVFASADLLEENLTLATYEYETGVSHIFTESETTVGVQFVSEEEMSDLEKTKKEEVITALKGHKRFTSKFDKDFIFAVANQMARSAGK